jgi:hydroxymethylpyrimidine pyrophosphatase-like HAD family hydrolase
LQEEEKQGRYKLSNYCEANRLDRVVQRIGLEIMQHDAPYHIIASVDPFMGEGLIDLLPRGVTKVYALDWWVSHQGHAQEAVIFAGDSGNDLAALSAGYRGIVVGNAPDHLWQKARRAHAAAGWTGRLFQAKSPATSGVLEGLRHFLGDGS